MWPDWTCTSHSQQAWRKQVRLPLYSKPHNVTGEIAMLFTAIHQFHFLTQKMAQDKTAHLMFTNTSYKLLHWGFLRPFEMSVWNSSNLCMSNRDRGRESKSIRLRTHDMHVQTLAAGFQAGF